MQSDQLLSARPALASARRLAAAFCFLSLLVGCDAPSPGAAAQPVAAPAPAMPPIPVKTGRPLRRQVPVYDEYTGRIEAVKNVDVRARVSGYLQQVNFKDGAKVKKGDLLFVVDPRPYQAALEHAEAQLEAARTRHERASNDLRRGEHLWENKAISEEDWDGRGKAVRENLAAVRSAEATLKTARLNLDYTVIRSPIDGRIGRELVTTGNLVIADQTVLATIVSTDPVYVYVDADERAVLRHRRVAAGGPAARSPAELALLDETGFPHQGYLDYADPRLDAATGTLKLRGVFPNSKELLSPGLFARVRVRGGAPENLLLIPDRAIGTDQGQKFVWLAKPDGGIEYRRIVTGGQSGALRAVREGLTADDEVVIEGIQKLRPGAKIKAERVAVSENG